jgi:nickel/cobalt transporter (NicO) family protein
VSNPRSCLIGAAFLAAALPMAPAARAHPHVFIEHTVTLVMKDGAPEGLRFSWVFDEMFSATLRSTFVKGKPDKLSKETVAEIEKRAFANLATYGYFIDLKINDEAVKVSTVTGFDVMFANGRAVYQFTVPLQAPKTQAKNAIQISVFDPEYYIDYRFAAARPYGIEPADQSGAACSFARDVPRQTEGWGVVGADVVTCSYPGK